jgi:transcriptional regulator with XRE-family HTH domain
MTQKSVATNPRTFRTFLLMQQFAAQEIGSRIAQARREHGGVTQEQLAELLNVSTRSVQDYEGGVTIPWKHFQQMARILDRPVEWFLRGEVGEPTSNDEIVERLERIEELVALLVQATGSRAAQGEG